MIAVTPDGDELEIASLGHELLTNGMPGLDAKSLHLGDGADGKRYIVLMNDGSGMAVARVDGVLSPRVVMLPFVEITTFDGFADYDSDKLSAQGWLQGLV
jgi:hypothetical protein